MWQAIPEPKAVSYSTALKAPNFSGFSDWRLPTKKSFTDAEKSGYHWIGKGFYWTSSKLKTTDMLDGFSEIINKLDWLGCAIHEIGTNLVRYVRALKASQFTGW